MTYPATVPTTLQRLPVVEHHSGLKRATIYKLVSQDEFPPPIQITGKAVAWISSEIAHWVDARIAARSQEEMRRLIRQMITQRSQRSGGEALALTLAGEPKDAPAEPITAPVSRERLSALQDLANANDITIVPEQNGILVATRHDFSCQFKNASALEMFLSAMESK